ncbi:hypothetical protein HN51_052722 [Arachis hypogaea]
MPCCWPPRRQKIQNLTIRSAFFCFYTGRLPWTWCSQGERRVRYGEIQEEKRGRKLKDFSKFTFTFSFRNETTTFTSPA